MKLFRVGLKSIWFLWSQVRGTTWSVGWKARSIACVDAVDTGSTRSRSTHVLIYSLKWINRSHPIDSYNGWDHLRSMDLRFNDDRPIKILQTRRSRAFPSSRDEDASRPSISDLTTIRWRRRFTNGHLITTVDCDESRHPTATPISEIF